MFTERLSNGLPRAFDCDRTHESPISSVGRKTTKAGLVVYLAPIASLEEFKGVGPCGSQPVREDDVKQIEITGCQH
jgi:hypothetical protein